VSPASDGAGSGLSHASEIAQPPSDIVAAGPAPPAEKRSAAVVATGSTVPAVPGRRLVSIGAQPAPRRTRTGCWCCSMVSVPSGFA
jgi:hypothetical protein